MENYSDELILIRNQENPLIGTISYEKYQGDVERGILRKFARVASISPEYFFCKKKFHAPLSFVFITRN